MTNKQTAPAVEPSAQAQNTTVLAYERGKADGLASAAKIARAQAAEGCSAGHVACALENAADAALIKCEGLK
jgi:hypothetical protein